MTDTTFAQSTQFVYLTYVANRAINQPAEHATDQERWNALTKKQRELLAAVAAPMSVKEAAIELGVSPSSVEAMLRRIRINLGTISTKQSVREFKRLEAAYGKTTHGVSSLAQGEEPEQSLANDAIQIPLAQLEDPGFIGLVVDEMGLSRLEALDARYGSVPRFAAVAGLMIALPVVMLLMAALAVMVSAAIG